MKQLFTLLFMVVISAMTNAQTTGKLHYEMEFSTDNPDMSMAVTMMEGSETDFYFIPGKTKIEMVMGTFMKISTTVDVIKQNGITLLEGMGDKMATEINFYDSGMVQNAAYPKILVGNERKTIIGFNCTKITAQAQDGTETILWVTNELITSLKGQQTFGNFEIEGIPLEFYIVNDGLTIHFTATKFDANVDTNIFSMEIPEDYQTVTEEELKAMGVVF